MDPLSIILIIFLLILLSAFFSGSETAFSSVNIIRIKSLAKEGNKKAKQVYNIMSNYSSLLTTILICNNIVNILSTAMISYLFGVKYNLGASGIGYATLIMTTLIIIFGEIFPKILARENAEKFTMSISGIISKLIFIFIPISRLIKILENMIKTNKNNVTATENELLEIVETIEHEGVLNQDERELIESAISFDDKLVKEIMTEKEDVVYIYDDIKTDDLINTILEYKYSRIPVLKRKNNHVVGIVHETEILENYIKNKNFNVVDMLNEAIYVKENDKLPKVLEKLQKNKVHIAIVKANKNSKKIEGIVTLEDVLEELVGEIYDEYDNLPANVVEIGHHSYEIDPNINVSEFFMNYLKEKPPFLKTKTFLGWLKELKGNSLFTVGEEFYYNNIVIKIAEVKDNNILRLDLKILTKKEEV